ncbi:MAG: flippase-like domain-containing protein [Magnetococcus sp. WYHC-3]
MPWLLKLAVSGGVIALLVGQLDGAALRSALEGMRWSWVLLATLVLALGQALCAWRWSLLARGMGLDLGPRRALGHYFSGMFLSLLLPGIIGGDAFRTWWLNRDLGGGRLWMAGASVLAERVNGVYGMLTLAVPAGWLYTGVIPRAWLLVSSAAWGALWLGWFLYPLLERRGRSALRRWGRLPDPQLLQLWWRPGGRWWPALGLSLVFQFMSAVSVWSLSCAVGAEVPLMFCQFLVVTAALILALPVSLAGHGVREGVFVLELGWLGVPPEVATLMGTLLFAVAALGALPGAITLWRRGPVPSPGEVSLDRSR